MTIFGLKGGGWQFAFSRVTAFSDLVYHVPNPPKWPKNAFKSIFGGSQTGATRYFLGFSPKILVKYRYIPQVPIQWFCEKIFKIRQKSNFLVKIHKKTTYLRYMHVFLWNLTKKSIFGGFWKNFQKNHCIGIPVENIDFWPKFNGEI